MGLFGRKKAKEEQLQQLQTELSAAESAITRREDELTKKEAVVSALRTELQQSQVDLFRERKDLEARIERVQKYLREHTAPNSAPAFSSMLFRGTAFPQSLRSYDYLNNNRLYSAMQQHTMHFSGPLRVSTEVESSSGNIYAVTLTGCTCQDFQRTGAPCKHMYKLAIECGLLSEIDTSAAYELLGEFDLRYQDLEQEHRKNTAAISKLRRLEIEAKKAAQAAEAKTAFCEESITRLKQETVIASPWLANQLADLEHLENLRKAKQLKNKQRPALKAAREVQRVSKALRDTTRYAKTLEYRLGLYQALFPWLEDLDTESPRELFDELQSSIASPDEERQVLGKWLSPQEYASLSEAEKYQLALERWRRRSRSNWQVGIDFERYVGYRYESQGYSVRYTGATEGRADFGRDLIVSDGVQTLIIQCKRWAAEKLVREKHVFQLYGSVVSYRLENPSLSVTGKLVTTCPLSPEARKFADYLGIDCEESYPLDHLDTYPLIKCNISKSGEKIYHLPFDQQYDHVVITPSRGEFYAHTVAEAIQAGFRRAWRWQGAE